MLPTNVFNIHIDILLRKFWFAGYALLHLDGYKQARAFDEHYSVFDIVIIRKCVDNSGDFLKGLLNLRIYQTLLLNPFF